MKHSKLLTIFCITLIFQTIGQGQTSMPSNYSENEVYKNETYRFSVTVPDKWKLHGQIQDDAKNHRAIVQWGLPPIYSELEKTSIENSVSITAYHKANISSVQELMVAEYLRSNPKETALEVDSTCTNARIIYHTQNGLEYKGKSYFVFKNGIGYVINFMATPGTYDKNIKVFEDFYLTIQYL